MERIQPIASCRRLQDSGSCGTGLPRKGGQHVNTVQVLQRESEKSKEGRQEAKDEGIKAVS